MRDWFLQRSRAKLAIALVLGALDRMVRRKLRTATQGELWALNLDLNKRCRELATVDSPYKNPSMGARMREWRNHPLKRYLDQEEDHRFKERMVADPDYYKTPLDDLSDKDLDSYIAWFRSKSPDEVDRLAIEERFHMWRGERRRSLPVLPSGSLPRQADVGRASNNSERTRHSFQVPKKMDAKEAQGSEPESESKGSFEIQDQEIH